VKTSFIVICDDLDNVKMPITQVVGFFATLGYQIDNINIIYRPVIKNCIYSILSDKCIILTPFDDEECLKCIKSAVDRIIAPREYQYHKFGYIAKGEDKICYIINQQLGNNIANLLKDSTSLFLDSTKKFLNIKAFSFECGEIISIANSIADNFHTNFSYDINNGDILLHFDSSVFANLEQVERNVYLALGDYIYIDRLISLPDALVELLTVQRKKLAILDKTEFQYFKSGCQIFSNSKTIEILEHKNKLDNKSKYKILGQGYGVLLIISQNDYGINLEFFDEFCDKNIQISFKSLQKYNRIGCFNMILYKILEKFKKST